MARLSDYYFCREKVPGYGRHFFLKVPQKAEDPGGGESLLGSVVEEAYETVLGFIRHSWYPVPRHVTEPRVVRRALERRVQSGEISIDADVVVSVGLAAASESITVERGASFEGGVGPFPGVPVNLGVDIDYSKMRKAVLGFGEGTRMAYIPMGYLARLYQNVEGDDRRIEPLGLLGRGNVVESILLARRFSVTFESEKAFDAGFESKLRTFERVPGADAKVSYRRVSERTLVARIDSEQEYLVALFERSWDDYDPD